MSGPSEGDDASEEEFMDILSSIIIEKWRVHIPIAGRAFYRIGSHGINRYQIFKRNELGTSSNRESLGTYNKRIYGDAAWASKRNLTYS
jgi:hypothetical protein